MYTFKDRALKCINAVGVVGQAFAMSPRPAGGQVATGALTANTRFTVAHGLGYTPRLEAIAVRPISLDDDAASYTLNIVKVSSTTITLKPSASVNAADTSILVLIDLDTDIGGRNSAF